MQIYREYASWEELRDEFESSLRKARVFVPGSYDVAERQICEMVLIHPRTGEWFPLKVEVVHIADAGIGLQLCDWGSNRTDALRQFVEAVSDSDPMELEPASGNHERILLSNPTPAIRIPTDLLEDSEGNAPFLPGVSEPNFDDGFALVPSSRKPSGPSNDGDPPSSSSPPSSNPPSSNPPSRVRASEPPPKNVQERVRRLNNRERDHMARQGTLTERVALERAYGPTVWDALLGNTSLTGPEVARIAKNGNATIPHLNIIVQNPAWLSKPEVRRALLTNPRLSPPQIERVLRALPPSELRKLPQQTAYTPQVRALARKLLPRS